MSKVTELGDLTNVEDPKEFMRHCSRFLSQLSDTFNGGIDFTTNINSQTISLTCAAANTEFVVPHKLNRTGVNYIVVSKDRACDIYRGGSTDTKSLIYLKSTVAGAVITLILI
jgi:hypothetical protein